MTNGRDNNRAVATRRPIVRWALIALIVLYAGYLAAANTLINTESFEKRINIKPDRVIFEWETLWTWFPGHISGHGLRLRTQSLRVQSETTADSASGWLSPTALLERTIRMRWVRVENLASKVRSAEMLRKAEPEEIAHFPEIDGFEPITPDSPREYGPFRPGWRVEVDDMRVKGSHRLAIGNYEISGSGMVSGDWSYRVRDVLEVPDGEVDLENATVSLNGEELVNGRLSGGFVVHPFEPYFHRGLEKAPFMSFDTNVDGALSSLEVLNYYLGLEDHESWQGLSASGTVAGRLSVDKGRVTEDTDLSVDAADIRFGTEAFEISSSGTIRLSPAEGDQDDSALMRFELGELDLLHRESQVVLLRVDGLRFLLNGRDVTIGTPLREVRTRAEIRDSGVPDLTAFNQFVPGKVPLSVLKGSGVLSGFLEWAGGEMDGSLTVGSRDLQLEVESSRLSGALSLKLELSARPESRFVSIDGTRIDIDDVILESGDSGIEPWRGRVDVSRGRVQLRKGAKLEVGGDGSVKRLVDFTDGELALSGSISNIDFLDYLLTEERRVTFHGPGNLDARLDLVGGSIGPGSVVRFDSSELAAHFLDFETRGSGELVAQFVEPEATRRLELAASIRDVVVVRDGSAVEFVESPSVDIQVTGRAPDVTEPLDDVEIDFAISRANVPDITVYNTYLPENGVLKLVSGSGSVTSRFEVVNKVATGRVEMSAPNVSAVINDNPVTFDMTLEVGLSDGDLEARRFSVDGSFLRVDNIRYPDGTTLDDWSTTFSFGDGTLHWTTPLALDADTRLDMSSSAPLIQLLMGRYSQLKWVDDLLSVNNVTGSSRLRLERDSLVLNNLDISGEKIRIMANLLIREEGAQGIVFNQYGQLKATVEFDGEERDWHLFSAKERFDQHPGY